MTGEIITVEVVYARRDRQVVLTVEVTLPATVREVIERSGILERFPEIDLGVNKIGIFGKPAEPEQALRDGDRIEIYRPLIADPKEARRRLAAQGKTMGWRKPPRG